MVLALLFPMLVSWSASAGAQTYPDRPVRMIIPYATGGGTDILMRYLMLKVEANEGWRVLDRKSVV